MNNGFEFQEKFISKLKSVIPPHLSIAEELADLLNVSTDSIYRRFRCQSSFTFDEIAAISSKFDVSLDELIEYGSFRVSFNFNPMYRDNGNFAKYLQWYSDYIEELVTKKGVRSVYAAADVPDFRIFNYSNLSAFKSFYWSKAVLNSESVLGKKFNKSLIPAEILEVNKQTYSNYCRLNRVEIWTVETLNSTLKQVEFIWESGLFEDREQALLIIHEIKQLMDELQNECEAGLNEQPGGQGEFTMYHSEVSIGDNCVLIEPGESQMNERVFIGYNTFNSLSTYNSEFCSETKYWMENLIKKSILLSGTAEKQRAIFFKRIANNIDQLENNVMGQ